MEGCVLLEGGATKAASMTFPEEGSWRLDVVRADGGGAARCSLVAVTSSSPPLYVFAAEDRCVDGGVLRPAPPELLELRLPTPAAAFRLRPAGFEAVSASEWSALCAPPEEAEATLSEEAGPEDMDVAVVEGEGGDGGDGGEDDDAASSSSGASEAA